MTNSYRVQEVDTARYELGGSDNDDRILKEKIWFESSSLEEAEAYIYDQFIADESVWLVIITITN